MKKRRWFAVLACAVLLCAGAFALRARRPFRELQASDIASATVSLLPPDVTVPVPDTEKLAELLREVVVYHQDDSYTEYVGQATAFTLVLADGTTMDVTVYTPFLILDGVGYQAKYEPCEALNNYANRLL